MTLDDIFGLRGHKAVVTGASSGLGVELATALAAAGADLALVARRLDRLEAVAHDLEPYGVKIACVPADLSELGALDDVMGAAEDAIGPIDRLVNNAGRSVAARAEKMSLEAWQEVLDLDLTSAFRLSQAFARRVIERQGEGSVVNIASVLASHSSSLPGLAAYAAAKGGLANLTRQLAVEWAGRGIRVNAICPGYFRTEMNDAAFDDEAFRGRIESFTPMARLGLPRELHSALLYALAPSSSFTTGSMITVDGGYTAW